VKTNAQIFRILVPRSLKERPLGNGEEDGRITRDLFRK
jgi:hypothetical protein